MKMKTRYRLVYRGTRGGMFYCVDKLTGKRTSLKTTDKDEAQQIVDAKNNSLRQPVLNLQIAKAYLAGSDNGVATRTWRQALRQPGPMALCRQRRGSRTTLAPRDHRNAGRAAVESAAGRNRFHQRL